MGNWIRVGKEDWINLDNIAHMWITNLVGRYFIEGEMIHNGEDVILSQDFDNLEDCVLYLQGHFNNE